MPTLLKHVDDLSRLIITIRGQRVILDTDLAALYGASTKQLNQQIRRNKDRFPQDFMFQLSRSEFDHLRSQIVTASRADDLMRSQFVTASKRNIRYLPYAFTEHGTIMAANVLNSPRAITMSVIVVRAFIRLRRMVLTVAELARKMNDLERKYDDQFKVVFEAIRQLMIPPQSPRRRIGFHGE